MRPEDGAGTVLAVALTGVVAVVAAAVAGVTGMVAGHRVAQSAADLAALAGATALQDGGDACARARTVATRNRARLGRCTVDGWEVVVVVSGPSPRLLGRTYELRARARAGPATGQGGGATP